MLFIFFQVVNSAHDQAATALRRSLNAVLVSLGREASECENPIAEDVFAR